jgi:hypothetical protein
VAAVAASERVGEGLVEFARWDECRGEVLLGRVGDDGGGVENFDNWGVAADVVALVHAQRFCARLDVGE